MKSIYKTAVFIIGIAMLSTLFFACGNSDDGTRTRRRQPRMLPE